MNSQRSVLEAEISSATSSSSFPHPRAKAGLSGGLAHKLRGVFTGTWPQGSFLLRHLPADPQVVRTPCGLRLPANGRVHGCCEVRCVGGSGGHRHHASHHASGQQRQTSSVKEGDPCCWAALASCPSSAFSRGPGRALRSVLV